MKKIILLLPLICVILNSCHNEKETHKGPLLGIDVSHFQGDVNWDKIKEHNISFAYAKATQGTSFKDPKFKENQKNTKQAGLKHGSYHFYLTNEDPIKQAEHYINTIEDLDEGHMLPMLDLEEGGIKGTVVKDKATISLPASTSQSLNSTFSFSSINETFPVINACALINAQSSNLGLK